jgi:hypothetical protein
MSGLRRVSNKLNPHLWDAIAVDHKTRKVRIFGEKKTLANAEAISAMAVMRRGCDEEFYTEVEAGTYKEADIYKSE